MGARPASAGAPGRRVSRAQGAARRAPGRRAEKDAPARGDAGRRPSGPSLLRGVREVDASGLLSRLRAPIVIAAVVLFVLVSVYPPAQGLYRAWRDQGVKQETLDGLNASIEEYQGDISRLQTREGIEDEARRRGFVDEGEVGVVLEGAPEESDDAPANEGEALPWYVALGDVVFQYEGK